MSETYTSIEKVVRWTQVARVPTWGASGSHQGHLGVTDSLLEVTRSAGNAAVSQGAASTNRVMAAVCHYRDQQTEEGERGEIEFRRYQWVIPALANAVLDQQKTGHYESRLKAKHADGIYHLLIDAMAVHVTAFIDLCTCSFFSKLILQLQQHAS